MGFACTRRFQGWLGLSLLAAVSAVVWAAKPAPPPPPPPHIKFNLKLFPATETATTLTLNSILGLNEAGDAVGQYTPPNSGGLAYPRVYLAGTVFDANELLTAAEQDSWNIERAFDINNAFQIAVRALYLGGADSNLIPGEYYVCLLDINPASENVGTLTPIFEYTLGGTVSSASIRSLSDTGVVCGEITAATRHAFFMAPGDEAPTYLFEEPWEPGATDSQAHDINAAGQVVGRRNAKGYRYTPGQPLLVFGQVETGKNVNDWGLGRSINSTGEFCGDATGKAGWLPVTYATGVGVVKLSTASGSATGINDRHDVIYQITAGGKFVYLSAENAHVNLLTAGVVQGNSAEVTRFRSNSPRLECLNEGRQIAGNFSDSATPALVAFILTPAP